MSGQCHYLLSLENVLTSNPVEHISRMMVRYRVFEKLYLDGSHVDIEEKLQEAVICLYAEILRHLSKAVSFFNEKTFGRQPVIEKYQIAPIQDS